MLLPSSPEYTCFDRLGICEDAIEDESGNIPFWLFLTTLLDSPVSCAAQLIDLLETIAVTRCGSSGSAGDYGLLKACLENRPRFFSHHWPVLKKLALEMPVLFPYSVLQPLCEAENHMSIVLSRRQVACLVVHQFLCTLQPLSWKDDNLHDFGCWYNSEQRHVAAVQTYLDALFLYFKQGTSESSFWGVSVQEWPVSYELHISPSWSELEPVAGSVPLAPIRVQLIDNYDTTPTSLGLPKGAAVISANKYVGFGQSATQEEVHVGISPEACPAVLVTPMLQDHQALVVTGAQAMVNLTGTRRDIVVTEMPVPKDDMQAWRHRTMLFMDALEIDEMDAENHSLPDLIPANQKREICKAAAAFSAGPYEEIRVGLWGCGAFCGDPAVKILLLWSAASTVGVRQLTISCDSSQHEIGRDLASLLSKIKNSKSIHTLQDLCRFVASAPLTLKRFETTKWYLGSFG